MFNFLQCASSGAERCGFVVVVVVAGASHVCILSKCLCLC